MSTRVAAAGAAAVYGLQARELTHAVLRLGPSGRPKLDMPTSEGHSIKGIGPPWLTNLPWPGRAASMASSARSRADRHGRDETILEHCFFPHESNEDQRNQMHKVCSNKALNMASSTTMAGGWLGAVLARME